MNVNPSPTSENSFSAPSGRAAPATLPEAPVRTGRILLGLVVLWLVLMMVFWADKLSRTHIRLHIPGAATESAYTRRLDAMEPHAKLFYPLSMRARDVTAGQALENLARTIGFTLADSQLARLGEQPMVVDYEDVPVYRVLHDLLASSALGFGLVGERMIFFEQQLETQRSGAGLRMLNWRAEGVDLFFRPLCIVPDGRSDLWFSVCLIGRAGQTLDQSDTVQVNVWRGLSLQHMAKTRIGEYGRAKLELATDRLIEFSLQRREAAGSNHRFNYELGFYYCERP